MYEKDHPSNYKGCVVYQKLYEKRYKTDIEIVDDNVSQNKSETIYTNSPSNRNQHVNYAEVVTNTANCVENFMNIIVNYTAVENLTATNGSSKNNNTQSKSNFTLTNFLNESTSMFNQLM